MRDWGPLFEYTALLTMTALPLKLKVASDSLYMLMRNMHVHVHFEGCLERDWMKGGDFH